MGVGKRGGGGGGRDKGCHTGADIPLMQSPTIKMEKKKKKGNNFTLNSPGTA